MSSRFILPFADVGSGIKPSSGAKLFFYATDGVTLKDTYSDQLSPTPTPNANPVIADSTGVFGDIYIDGAYKVTLQDKNGSQIFGGAIVSDPTAALINDLSQAYQFGTIDDIDQSGITFLVGKPIVVEDYATDHDSGILFFNVAADTGQVDDGGKHIYLPTLDIWIEQNMKLEPTFKDFGAAGDGVKDDTAAISATLDYTTTVDATPGTYLFTQINKTPPSDLIIRGENCILKCISPTHVKQAFYISAENAAVHISGITVDSNELANQGICIQNEGGVVPRDVTLDNVSSINVRRATTEFIGGDGIWVRGGFRRVVMNNPIVKNCKIAAGAGLAGQVGMSGISVVQDFAQTVMPRFVEINNPYVEDIYSEDPAYTNDQDGARFFGLETEFVEESSCVINGGVFKNCWGRSLKFQRPDGIVNGTTFIRTEGNNTGFGNTEIDFQRGGGTVRDIICNYTDFNPGTIVNSYLNQFDTYKFLVDGVSAKLNNTTLLQVVQRFSQAQADKAIPILIKNIKVVGAIGKVLRYLTQNSSVTDLLELASLEDIYFEQADFLAQVYGNNTSQRVDMYARNISTSGTGVVLIDEGDFSNDVEVRFYQDYLRGFTKDTDSSFVAALDSDVGTITLDPAENTLHYMRKGRVLSIWGRLAVSAISAPAGILSLNLPFQSQAGFEIVSRSQVVIDSTVSKNANDFALNLNGASFTSVFLDVSGNVSDATTVASQMQVGTKLLIRFEYITEENF